MFVKFSIFFEFFNIDTPLTVTCHHFHIQNTASFYWYGSHRTIKGSKPAFLPGIINRNNSINNVIITMLLLAWQFRQNIWQKSQLILPHTNLISKDKPCFLFCTKFRDVKTWKNHGKNCIQYTHVHKSITSRNNKLFSVITHRYLFNFCFWYCLFWWLYNNFINRSSNSLTHHVFNNINSRNFFLALWSFSFLISTLTWFTNVCSTFH